MPAEDELEGVINLRIRADFVALIQLLELDWYDALADGFKAAVN